MFIINNLLILLVTNISLGSYYVRIELGVPHKAYNVAYLNGIYYLPQCHYIKLNNLTSHPIYYEILKASSLKELTKNCNRNAHLPSYVSFRIYHLPFMIRNSGSYCLRVYNSFLKESPIIVPIYVDDDSPAITLFGESAMYIHQYPSLKVAEGCKPIFFPKPQPVVLPKQKPRKIKIKIPKERVQESPGESYITTLPPQVINYIKAKKLIYSPPTVTTYSIIASDPSGIKEIKYRINGGQWKVYNPETKLTLFPAHAIFPIEILAKDNVGHITYIYQYVSVLTPSVNAQFQVNVIRKLILSQEKTKKSGNSRNRE